MQTISPTFRQALTTSHSIVTRVDAYYNGQLTVADLPIMDGSVTVDRGSKVRRSLSLTVADVKYLPWKATDPLAVYGQQLVVSRGIRFATGQPEMVPLGTFRIDEPQGDIYAGPVTLTGKSAEAIVQDDQFTAPTTTRGYGNCVQAIEYLIRQTIPGAPVVNLTSGSRNPPCAVATWDAGGDRWDAVRQIATAMQADISVDPIGRFVLVDVPEVLSSRVVWDVSDGETGNLVAASRQMSRAAVYNAVVATGENTASNTPPVSAVAYDTAPNSPTRWGGPFGRKPKRYSSALLTTVGACQAAANYMLFDAIAPNVTTSISAIPNPALEAGDCVRLTYAKGKRELFIVQSFSVPLTADGGFPLTLRGGKEEM